MRIIEIYQPEKVIEGVMIYDNTRTPLAVIWVRRRAREAQTDICMIECNVSIPEATFEVISFISCSTRPLSSS